MKPCTEFLRVLDLFAARNRIVHGGRLGLTEKEPAGVPGSYLGGFFPRFSGGSRTTQAQNWLSWTRRSPR